MKLNPCPCGTDKPPIGISGMPSGVCTIHCPGCDSFAQGNSKSETIRNWNKAYPKKRAKR